MERRWGELSEECKHRWRVSGVEVQGGHVYQEQRPWRVPSCFHRFPDVGLERRRDEGGGGWGRGGESGREKDVMTPTTTTSEAQSSCDRGAGRSLVSSVCCKHEPAGSGWRLTTNWVKWRKFCHLLPQHCCSFVFSQRHHVLTMHDLTFGWMTRKAHMQYDSKSCFFFILILWMSLFNSFHVLLPPE